MRHSPDNAGAPARLLGSGPARHAPQGAACLLLFTLVGAAGPGAIARADDLVLEAAFVADAIPPEGTDLNLSLVLAPDEASQRGYGAQPRVQLATRLAPDLGLAVDAGLAGRADGQVTLAPFAASLKVGLTGPDGGPWGLGLHASADLQADPAVWSRSEAGLGLGATRGMGPLTWRLAAWAMSAVGRWDPHAHAGLSVALAPAARVRLLLEAVADLRSRGAALAAGPTLKLEVAPGTTLAAGGLFGLAHQPGVVAVLIQIGRAL